MYKYEEERPEVFTEQGLDGCLKILDNLHKSPNGMLMYYDAVKGSNVSSSWTELACIDYLKEKYYINIGDVGKRTQDNIIVLKSKVYTDE